MKWMKRLRLINWHYFEDETLEFGKQTLITGKNAAGKSTIIDALQVLFVADQRQIRFNAAAHDEAKRSMIHYLRGKIGNDERTFLRDGDFTTYIVAEFYDAKKQEPFIVGVVIDVFRDQEYEAEYFILSECRLQDLEFVKPSGELRNRDEFRRLYSGGGSGRNRAVFERNKSNYQKAFLARMGQVHERFFQVFTRALSFKPIKDIREFVYEHILEKRELQLDLMKQNFEIHERYQQELAELERRRDKLLAIRAAYEQFAKWREIAAEQDYVVRRLRWVIAQEELEKLEKDLAGYDEKLAEADEAIRLARQKQEEAAAEKQAAYHRWQSHEAERRKQGMEERIQQYTVRMQQLRRELSNLELRLQQELALLSTLADWTGCEGWQWQEGERERLQRMCEWLADVHGCVVREEPLAATVAEELVSAGKKLMEWRDRAKDAASRLSDQLQETEKKIAELERIIQNLERKQRPYTDSVVRLKSLLESQLGERSEVWIFCEQMEIRDEAWRNAIEGYLNTQRFDLLVEPDVFAEALAIYEREKWNHRLEGVGLVDTEKERKYLGTALPGSLAHELDAAHPVIRAHVEHLLGKVMKADNEQELRKYRTAVTKSCMVYHNLVARQIPKRHYEVPFIGEKAIARQLEMRRQELVQLKEQWKQLAASQQQLAAWAERLTEKQLHFSRLAEKMTLPSELEQTKQELQRSEEELASLLASGLFEQAEKLKQEYEAWQQAEKEWGERLEHLSKQRGRWEEARKHTQDKVWQQQRAVDEAKTDWQAWRTQYGPEAEQRALLRWEEAVRSEQPLARKLENWENNRKGNLTRREQEFQRLKELRQQFNFEYAFNGPVHDEANEAYDQLLHHIEHLDLPAYQQKVEQALKESEEEFKSHFVFKLREAIQQARREFDELNYALRHFPFSEDRYHFEVTPSDRYKRFYDAVMDPLLLEQDSLFAQVQEERVQALHELFETLVRGEAGDVEEFTDYRRYLDFDIIVTTRDARYRFSQVLKEKSGGETQTPFYIAILASFHHLYNSGKTVRLVVFDEAFNKMDEQRIKSSLRLIKQMNLQLIAAVPDEKMQHMVPEVTTTLIVSKHDYRCFVDLLERWDEDASAEMGDSIAEVAASDELEAVQESLF